MYNVYRVVIMRIVNSLYAQIVGVNVARYTYAERYYPPGIQTQWANYVSTFSRKKTIQDPPQNVCNKFTKNVSFRFKKNFKPLSVNKQILTPINLRFEAFI